MIKTKDRIMALLSPPSQDVYLVVEDARWIANHIEELEAENERLTGQRDRLGIEYDAVQKENERLTAALKVFDPGLNSTDTLAAVKGEEK